jgi:hypothetical protein
MSFEDRVGKSEMARRLSFGSGSDAEISQLVERLIRYGVDETVTQEQITALLAAVETSIASDKGAA